MRHHWLATYVPDIEALIAGAELDPEAPDELLVGLVPAFAWAPATSRHGAKGRGSVAMPYRVDWDVLSSGLMERSGTARGPGRSLAITVEPEGVTAGQVRQRAEDARWHLFEEMSRWAPRAVASAHGARSAEVAASTGRADVPLLDGPDLEALTNELMLGEQGFFARMLGLVVRRRCFDRVDPQRWIRTMLRREADQAVGRAVGDVLPGPRVRRIAAAHGDQPLETVVALYNQGISRTNRIAADRAARALLVGRLTPASVGEGQLEAALPAAPSAEDMFLGVGA